MEVTFQSGSKIKITPKKIREVLGIPMGKKKLEYDSPREYDDEFIKAFKAQFHAKKYITITDLSKQLQRTTNTEMLFSKFMIHCDNSSRLIYYVIKNIKSTDIISDFDWCKFIWDHIQTSKNTWDDRTLENWYYGPNTVLMIGLVEVIEDDDKEDENEKDVEKRESGDEKLPLYVKKFQKEFTIGLRKDNARAGNSGVGNEDGNEDGAD
nr:hypothetical protein [Tanacetum cinerariifolium]